MTVTGYTLVIDVGGQSLRALLFAGNRKLVHSCYKPYSQLTKSDVCIEHNPMEILQQLQALLNEITAYLAARRGAVTHFGLAVQRSSIVCWDRLSKQPLSPVISWQDTRGQYLLDQLSMDNASVKRKTGLVVSAHYGASKIKWCLNNYKLVQNALQQERLVIAPLSALLSLYLSPLSDRLARVDPGIAARTLLYNIEKNKWDAELLAQFGIARKILAQVDDNFSVLDEVKAFPAAESTLVLGDQCAVPFSLSDDNADSMFLNLGSGGFILKRIKESAVQLSKLSASPFLASLLLHKAGRKYFALEATINGAANAVRWYTARSGLSKGIRYRDLAASSINEVYFINAVGGLGSPFWRSDIEPEFVGQGDSSAELKAIYESILFLVKINLVLIFDQVLEQKCSTQVMHLSGGMAGDEVFCQALADLCGLHLHYRKQHEATVLGTLNLLLPNCSRPAVAPDLVFLPQENAALKKRYETWKVFMNQRTGSDY